AARSLADSLAEPIGRLLASAQRPLFVVGDDIDEASSRELTAWASANRVPLVADFRTYGQLDNYADCYVGALGVGKGWEITEWVAEADLLIYLGCVRSDINSDHLSAAFDRTTVVVGSADVLPFHCGRLDHLVEVPPSALCYALPDRLLTGSSRKRRSDWLQRGRAEYERSTDVKAAVAV